VDYKAADPSLSSDKIYSGIFMGIYEARSQGWHSAMKQASEQNWVWGPIGATD